MNMIGSVQETSPLPRQRGTYWVYLVWLYVVALAAAEVTIGFDRTLGFYLHLGLALLFLTGSYAATGEAGTLHVALVAVPFLRLLAMTVSVWSSDLALQRVLVYAPLLLSALIAARVLGYALLGGLRRTLLYTPLLALTGPFIGALVYAGGHPILFTTGLNWSGGVANLDRVAVWLALALLGAGLAETVLFLGVLLPAAVKLLGAARGVAFSALLYASLYLGHPWPFPALIFLLGVLFGALALRPGTLLGLALAHGLAYVTTLLVMPLLGAG